MQDSPTFKEHLQFTQILRAMACLAVVWGHWESFFAANAALCDIVRPLSPCPSALPHASYLVKVLTPLRPVFSLATCAVGLFFLISGFLIPLVSRRQSRAGFLAGRFLRVVPVYWFSLGLTCAVRLVYSRAQGVEFSPSIGTLTSNALLVRYFFWLPTLDYVNWTLEIEILFYLIWAAMGTRGGFAGKHTVVLVSFLLTIGSVFAGRINAVRAAGGLAYVDALLGIEHLFPFVIFIFQGVCFANLYSREWSTRQFTVYLTVVFACWWASLHGGCLHRSWPQLRQFSVALVVFAMCYRFRDRLPKSAWLCRLADFSYPLYLLHGVIGYILLTVLYPWFSSPYLDVLFSAVVILSLVCLVHEFVENPFH